MRKIILSAIAVVILLGFFSCIVSTAEDRLYIKVGELRSIITESPYRVSISDPQVADITSVVQKEILIVGKTPGNTILNIWDKWGKQTVSIDVYLESLSLLQDRVQKLLNSTGIIDANLKINPDENKIVIDGTLKEAQKSQFELLIDPFKEKMINLVKFAPARKSVLIDVNILELDKSAVDKLGIDWPDILNITLDKVESTKSFLDLFQVTKWGRSELTSAINLMVQSGKGRVLSRPKLVCLSGEEAEFLVGGEVPIVTTVVNETGTSVNVTYRDYGVSLKIKPTVEGEDGIRTSMTTEVSEIDLAHAVLGVPAFLTRKASTELFIKQDQTIFLAGLLKNKDQSTISKVPAVGDIPVIGHLFRSRDFTNDQTELVITLTPSIIDSDSESRFVSTAQQEKGTIEVREEKLPETKTQPQADIKEPISKYAESIHNIINKQFVYPKEAKEQKQAGTVTLSVKINSDGKIDDVKITQSSGYEILDSSAVSLVQTIAKFDPFPDSIPLSDLLVSVPIQYNLE